MTSQPKKELKVRERSEVVIALVIAQVIVNSLNVKRDGVAERRVMRPLTSGSSIRYSLFAISYLPASIMRAITSDASDL